jgi:phosphoribosylformylglycinamidine synthase
MATVRVYVTLKPALLDSAGRTVAGALNKLGYDEIEDTRVGKIIELKMDKVDQDRVKEMCERLLANPVIENYRFEVVQ